MPLKRPESHSLADAAVNAFERSVLEMGWVWNPTRSGGDYGIDGFLTPTEDNGNVLSFEIPIQVKGVGKLLQKAGRGIANPVTREGVDILRTHVLCGYFIIFDASHDRLYYCSARDIGVIFDKKGGQRRRLEVPLSNVLSQRALYKLRQRAIEEHLRLIRSLRIDIVRDAAERLYASLAGVRTVLFEFVAALALFDAQHLVTIYQSAAAQIAESEGKPETATDDLSKVLRSLNEYEVDPPSQILGNFPGAGLMLATLQLAITEMDRFIEKIGPTHRDVAQSLGISGLRSMLKAALDRSFRRPDGSPIEIPKEGSPPSVSWMTIDLGHYYLSTSQVALVINRLMFEIHTVVFPVEEFGPSLGRPPNIWIRHRLNEVGFSLAEPNED